MRALFASQLLLLLAVCGFGPPRISDASTLPDFEVQTPQLAGIRLAAIPPLTAKAAISIELDSGRVLYESNAHDRLPPASTTKIMTALLTLEHGGLDQLVTVSPVAAAEPGTTMNLAAGQQLTVMELLYGLLLPSGNDAALALAQFQTGGSLQAFVVRMNQRAAELGLSETHFVNADGLDDPGHLMSVSDMAKLARFALLHQPLLDQLVATAHEVIPATPTHPAFDLTNLDQLLGTYPGADGVKTGTTPAAGQDLVGSATRGGHRLMVVVYGSTDRYADARVLLDHAFGDTFWLRASAYYPYALPVLLRDTADALVPSWEASQIQAFVDADALQATFSVAARMVLTVPVEQSGSGS